MPDAVSLVAMVCHADQSPQHEVFDSGLLLYFPQSCGLYVLSGVLMPFGQIPESVSADKKVVSAAVGDQPASGIHFQEFRTDLFVCLADVVGRNAYPVKRV